MESLLSMGSRVNVSATLPATGEKSPRSEDFRFASPHLYPTPLQSGDICMANINYPTEETDDFAMCCESEKRVLILGSRSHRDELYPHLIVAEVKGNLPFPKPTHIPVETIGGHTLLVQSDRVHAIPVFYVSKVVDRVIPEQFDLAQRMVAIGDIRRGDILMADLSSGVGHEQCGIRPVVVLQNDTGNRHSPTLVVAAVTSKKKKPMPTHVSIKMPGGRQSTVLLEQIRTIDRERLLYPKGTCSSAEMERIDRAARVSIGLTGHG